MKKILFVVLLATAFIIGWLIVKKSLVNNKESQYVGQSLTQIYFNNWYGYRFNYPQNAELFFTSSPLEKNYLYVPYDDGPRVFLGGKDNNDSYNGPVCDIRIFPNRNIQEWNRPGANISTVKFNSLIWDKIIYKGSDTDIYDSPIALWHTTHDYLLFAMHAQPDTVKNCEPIVASFIFFTPDSDEWTIRSKGQEYITQKYGPDKIYLSGSYIEGSYVKGGKLIRTSEASDMAALVFDDKETYVNHNYYQRTVIILKKINGIWQIYEEPIDSKDYIAS